MLSTTPEGCENGAADHATGLLVVPLWGVRPDSPRPGRGDAGSSARLPVASWLPRRVATCAWRARTVTSLSRACWAGALRDGPLRTPTRISARAWRKPALQTKSDQERVAVTRIAIASAQLVSTREMCSLPLPREASTVIVVLLGSHLHDFGFVRLVPPQAPSSHWDPEAVPARSGRTGGSGAAFQRGLPPP